MLVASGQTRNGLPTISVELSGTGPRGRMRRARAMIDTGFNGTIMLPVNIAARIGATAEDTTTVSLADGTPKRAWVTDLRIRCGQLDSACEAYIEPECRELLIGTDFLRRFDLTLLVTPLAVMFLDQGTTWWPMHRPPPSRRIAKKKAR